MNTNIQQNINKGSVKRSNLAFIDIETTGTNVQKHEIIEIACIIAKQIPRENKGPKIEKIEEFDIKIKPTRIEDAEPQALRINGYNESDWVFASDLKTAMAEFSKKVDGCILVGQNITFDWSFLEKAFIETNTYPSLHHHKLDTMSIAFAKFYDDNSLNKLGLYFLCEHLGVKNENAHTALSDTRATYEIYKKLLDA